MSQRRMTSLEVTGTDAFLDMPQSSQLLYFHLNSLADDDGFVANPKSIMRNCGSQADDLKLLIFKKFVIAFDDGVCVIKHWRINNFIRKDIYKETKYLDLKRTLFIRPNGAYTLTDDGKAIPLPPGHFNLEDVNDTLTKRQPRLGKVRVGKDRLGKVSKDTLQPAVADEVNQIMDLFYKVNPTINYGNTTQRKAIEFVLAKWGLEACKSMVEKALAIQGQPYAPVITTPIHFKDKIAQVKIFLEKQNPNKGINILQV